MSKTIDGANADDRLSPMPESTDKLVASSWTDQSVGGANRDRTDDLKLAKLALSQLSYGPKGHTT